MAPREKSRCFRLARQGAGSKMIFEYQTLLITFAVAVGALSVSLIYYAYKRKTYPGFNLWAVGTAVGGIALLLSGLRQYLPPYLAVVLANTLFFSAYALIYAGFKSFLREEKASLAHLYVGCPVIAVLYWLLTYPFPSIVFRIVAISFCGCIYAILGFQVLIKTDFGTSNRGMLVLLLLFSLTNLIRGLTYLVSGSGVDTYLLSGPVNTLSNLGILFLSILFIIGLIQMNAQKLEEEIKTLQGIIPICARCKKIRDDSGFWENVESYIEKYSDAVFSHGSCPECMEELYGDRPWYIEMKAQKKQQS